MGPQVRYICWFITPSFIIFHYGETNSINSNVKWQDVHQLNAISREPHTVEYYLIWSGNITDIYQRIFHEYLWYSHEIDLTSQHFTSVQCQQNGNTQAIMLVASNCYNCCYSPVIKHGTGRYIVFGWFSYWNLHKLVDVQLPRLMTRG